MEAKEYILLHPLFLHHHLSIMRILHGAILLLATTEAPAFAPAQQRNSLNYPRQKKESTSTSTLQLQANDVTNGVKDVFAVVDDKLKSLVGSLDNVNIAINGESQELLKVFLSKIQTVLEGETALQQEFSKFVAAITGQIDQWLLAQSPEVEAVFKQTLGQISSLSFNTPEAIGVTTIITYFVVSSVLTWGEAPPPSKPYPLSRYDPVAAQAYFDSRPVQFVARALQIAIKSLGFGLSFLQDKLRYVWGGR
jgi:hypothetical protein